MYEINKSNSDVSFISATILNKNKLNEKTLEKKVILFLCIISLFISGCLIFNMASFFPLFVE